MTRLLLGDPLPGRYPRWNYLDRLETNAAMPRACLTTLALLALLAIASLLVHTFWFEGLPSSTASPERLFSIAPMPRPIVPPPMRLLPNQENAAISPPPRGTPEIVDEALAPDENLLGSSPGTGDGSSGKNSWTATGVDGNSCCNIVSASVLPGPEDFVAVEHQPELLFMPVLQYPELARDAGIEGTVLVRALVAADGSVRETRILQGIPGLEEAALQAVAGAVFRPARQQDRPVAVWVVVPIEFRLRP